MTLQNDKCQHLLKPLSQMKLQTLIKWTRPFSSSGLLGVVFHSYSNFNRTSYKQTVENLIKLCSLWRLILACIICLYVPQKERQSNMGKYFCCICYSHQLYCCFIELDTKWILSDFNHMQRHGVCHMWDRTFTIKAGFAMARNNVCFNVSFLDFN